MCNINLEEDIQDLEDIIVDQYIQDEKGQFITVADFLKDEFSFYKDELPSITYYAIGKQKKIYYNLGMNLSDYCKEITYMEFQKAEKNNRREVNILDIDELYLRALYNLYKSKYTPT